MDEARIKLANLIRDTKRVQVIHGWHLDNIEAVANAAVDEARIKELARQAIVAFENYDDVAAQGLCEAIICTAVDEATSRLKDEHRAHLAECLNASVDACERQERINNAWLKAETTCLREQVATLEKRDDNSWAVKYQNLLAAVQSHHAQKADDRCIEDDTRLYFAAGLTGADHRVGDKFEMLKNCARFIDNRCKGGEWPSYAELESQVATLSRQLENALEILESEGRLAELNAKLKPMHESGVAVPYPLVGLLKQVEDAEQREVKLTKERDVARSDCQDATNAMIEWQIEHDKTVEEAVKVTPAPLPGSATVSSGWWKHFRGGVYEVVGNCTIEKTCEPGVLYRGGETGRVWCRPLGEWHEMIDIEHPSRPVPRFAPIEAPIPPLPANPNRGKVIADILIGHPLPETMKWDQIWSQGRNLLNRAHDAVAADLKAKGQGR